MFGGTLQMGEGGREFKTVWASVKKNNHEPSSLAVVPHKVIDGM
jgi:hypothetical protein